MNAFLQWVDKLDWIYIILFCIALGLAPFNPPHIVEKIGMLLKGTLKKPIDWFDLFFHSTPWIILIIKIIVTVKNKQ